MRLANRALPVPKKCSPTWVYKNAVNLKPEYTTQFAHDVKRLVRKHVDTTALREVVKLILADTADARNELRRRHNMH